MSNVVLIRPGCTDFDEQQRVQGTLDLPLNRRGQEQIRQIALELREVPLEILYTSPSEPARSSALAIGRILNVPVKELEGLRSFNQGLWQGLQVDEIRRKHPRVFKQWVEAPETICPPGGETVAGTLERIHRALEKPLKREIPFGVVAPEPLASMIACLVENRKLDLGESLCGTAKGSAWQILNWNGLQTRTTSVGASSALARAAGESPR
jgi:probable phosphoglycerate mutase